MCTSNTTTTKQVRILHTPALFICPIVSFWHGGNNQQEPERRCSATSFLSSARLKRCTCSRSVGFSRIHPDDSHPEQIPDFIALSASHCGNLAQTMGARFKKELKAWVGLLRSSGHWVGRCLFGHGVDCRCDAITLAMLTIFASKRCQRIEENNQMDLAEMVISDTVGAAHNCTFKRSSTPHCTAHKGVQPCQS